MLNSLLFLVAMVLANSAMAEGRPHRGYAYIYVTDGPHVYAGSVRTREFFYSAAQCDMELRRALLEYEKFVQITKPRAELIAHIECRPEGHYA